MPESRWFHRSLPLLACVLLVACSSATPPAPTPAAQAPAAPGAAAEPTRPPALTPLTVGYGAVTGVYIPLWLALDQGYFEKHGLAVELVHLPGNTGPQSLIAGQVPVMGLSGFAAAPSMIEGADLVVISMAANRMTAQVYSVPAVDAPPALRGKRMGITRPGTLTYFAALLALRDWGLRPDQDVALVSFNEVPSILGGMLEGAADAGILTEPTAFQADAEGLRLLADLADSPTEYLTSGMTTTHAYAQQNRSVLLSLLEGYAEGTRRYFDDRPTALETLKKYARIDDPAILDKTYALYAEKYLLKNPLPSVAAMQNILDDYAEVNPKARDVDASKLVDPSFVQELQREGFLHALGLE